MRLMIDYARSDGLKEIHGKVALQNTTMLSMCREMGLAGSAASDDPGKVLVALTL